MEINEKTELQQDTIVQHKHNLLITNSDNINGAKLSLTLDKNIIGKDPIEFKNHISNCYKKCIKELDYIIKNDDFFKNLL
ncbi:hypothetical protein [Metaclostridioides mangenotii]|uniref:hypothetical protein n=1 Tax=Metaclostridioides mangenotii TaxID=1540 RepID=UPI0004660EE7|nr:hypothetical protein [Clostridioides mangenotii]